MGEIIKRFEQKGFKLVALKLKQATKEHLSEHYADLKSKPFFGGLVDYMASGPVVCMVRLPRLSQEAERPLIDPCPYLLLGLAGTRRRQDWPRHARRDQAF